MSENAKFSPLHDKLVIIKGEQLFIFVLRDMIAVQAVSKVLAQRRISFAPTMSFKNVTLYFLTIFAETIIRTYQVTGHQRSLTVHVPTIITLQMHSPLVHVSPPFYAPAVPGRACYSTPNKASFIRCAHNFVLSEFKVKQEGRALLYARELLEWYEHF
ncbi:hypothetical protein F5877DRAFT_82281 [Lentinula edodes]|nr:hypothetical protein F5877DRAFT_82281 [Lentinula edodes]